MVGVRKSTLVKFQTQVVIAFKRRLNEYIPNKLAPGAAWDEKTGILKSVSKDHLCYSTNISTKGTYDICPQQIG